MKSLHKEPLIHFLLTGAAMFALYYWINPVQENANEDRIIIAQADIDRLQQGWESKWNRQISGQELQALIDAHIREEIYYREALALGLDKDDTVLRRRLQQKLEFLTNDIIDTASPDQAMLEDYLTRHKDRYLLPATITFRHVYFSPDQRGNTARLDAEKVLTALSASIMGDKEIMNTGDAFFLEHEYTNQSQQQVERAFGSGFAEQLFQAKPSIWSGPFKSAYGTHLVQVIAKTASKVPELSSVRDKVERDWRYDQRQQANEAIFQRLKEKYEIVIEQQQSIQGNSHAQLQSMDAS